MQLAVFERIHCYFCAVLCGSSISRRRVEHSAPVLLSDVFCPLYSRQHFISGDTGDDRTCCCSGGHVRSAELLRVRRGAVRGDAGPRTRLGRRRSGAPGPCRRHSREWMHALPRHMSASRRANSCHSAGARASERSCARALNRERERAEQKGAERRGEEKRRESRAQESTRIGSRCSVPGDEVRDIAAPHSLCLCKCPCLPVYSSHSHRHLVGPCLAYIGGAQSSLHLCRGATAPGRVASWRHSVLVTVDVGWGGPRPTRRGPGTGVRHEPPPRLSWSSMLSAVYSRRIPQETSGPHKPVAAQAYPSTSLPQHKPAPAQACRSTSLPQHKPAAA